jgi:hypothetical protein
MHQVQLIITGNMLMHCSLKLVCYDFGVMFNLILLMMLEPDETNISVSVPDMDSENILVAKSVEKNERRIFVLEHSI